MRLTLKSAGERLAAPPELEVRPQPAMHYLPTTKTSFRPPDWKVRITRAIVWFLPRASPDHERLYPRVKKWLLEIDEAGLPSREIGLADDGTPLFTASN